MKRAQQNLSKDLGNGADEKTIAVPRVLWRLAAPLIARPLLWLNIGVFPVVREKLGLSWRDADERRVRR